MFYICYVFRECLTIPRPQTKPGNSFMTEITEQEFTLCWYLPQGCVLWFLPTSVRYIDAFPLINMYYILWNASVKYFLFELSWSPISAVCRYYTSFPSTTRHQTRAHFSLCLIRNQHDYSYLAACGYLINTLMNNDNWCQDEYGINLLLHWVSVAKFGLRYQLHMKSYIVIGSHDMTMGFH